MPVRRRLVWFERLLWLTAAVALGGYGYGRLSSVISQSYESWSFVQTLNGQPVSPQEFVTHLLGGEAAAIPRPPKINAPPLGPRPATPWPVRLEIPRLQLTVMVKEGTDRRTLARAVGHIPGTAMPGSPGNMGVAGHRDTYFRRLGELKIGDPIHLTTLGGDYLYKVASIRIVRPSETDVLLDTGQPSLTLVTCYPFWSLGRAPKRYIVRATLDQPNSPLNH